MKQSNQKGNVLLFAIVAMTAISVLGTGIYFMTTTSTFSGLEANAQNRAYQLAVAGRDYALAKNLPNTTIQYPSGRTFTFANGDKYVLKIGVNNPDEITSTGIVKEGTPYEARRTITATKTGFGSQADISFTKDIAAFSPGIKESQAGFVNVDQTAAQISLGQYQPSQFGSVWYSGNATPGNCQNGKCNFGEGFTAFFVFRMQKSSFYSLRDGFTFALFNGEDNDLSSVGGHGGMGELMSYAGSSYVSGSTYLDGQNGKGIQPPKMAVEFDPYPNTGTGSVCPPSSGNRNDGSYDHMAYVFWGYNSTACAGYGTTDGQKSYDDNRHGAGSGIVNEPQNSLSTDANSYFTGGPSWGGSWFERPLPYAFRIEVRRSDPGTGNYNYELKSWIKECPDFACTAYSLGTFGNTKATYTADSPTIKRTVADGNQIVLNSSYHSKFDKFLFGWTAATGGATQNVILKDFRMYFEK